MRIRRISGLLLLLASWGTSGAQTGGNYDLTWSSLDCGSDATSAGNNYSLLGTVGQPDVGDLAGNPYSLHGGFWNGTGVPTDVPPPGVDQGSGSLVFRLNDSAPNPFAKTTSIAFSLAHEVDVDMRVYDLAGRLVRNVLERRLPAGRHQVVWDGRDDSGRRTAFGIYVLRLRAGAFQAQRKLALVP